jgi:hypothetical protein
MALPADQAARSPQKSMRCKIGSAIIAALLAGLASRSAEAGTPPFRFDGDTVGFANMTVFEYQNGIARLRRGESAKQKRYTRRCFVLCRTTTQFKKFARFDPHAPPLDDGDLAKRIRQVTRRAAWHDPLPDDQRVVFPGYANLRQLSKARGFVLQRNIGYGWPTYWRLGNARTFFEPGVGYQERTHEKLNSVLERGDLFVGFLTTLPKLRINHAVLFYAKEAGSGEVDRYLVYDPNHPEGPRHLWWSPRERSFEYEKDWDFVGGRVRVYQIYGMPLQ